MKTIILLFLFILPTIAFCQLGGTYKIGTTGCGGTCDYSSITGSGGFFEDIVNLGINGNVVALVYDDLAEDGATVLTNFIDNNGPHTITIQPDGSTTHTISGTNDADGIIALLGAHRIIIDGRDPSNPLLDYTNRHLIIKNTSMVAPVISIGNDAVSCAIRSTIIEGSNQVGGVIEVGGGSASGNDDLTLEYNDVKDNGGNLPRSGITMTGGPGGINDNVRINNNHIYDFFPNDINGGYGIDIGNFNGSVSIDGNSIYQTSDRTMAASYPYGAIIISSAVGNGFVVKNNFIGGSSANCGGSSTTFEATGGWVRANLIQIEDVGFTATTVVSGNTIKKIATTSFASSGSSQASLIGILVNRGAVDVFNNTIGDNTDGLTANFDASNFASAGLLAGVAYITNPTGTGIGGNIEGNKIDHLFVNATGSNVSATSEVTGVYFDQQTDPRPISIKKNIIGSLTGPVTMTTSGSATNTLLTVGIDIVRSNAAISIDRNKIANLSNQGLEAGSYTRGISITGAANMSITQNQIFSISSAASNLSTSGAASGIFVNNASLPGLSILRNIVHSITNPSGAIVGGVIIGAVAPGVNPHLENNMITLGFSQTSDSRYYGIYNNTTITGTLQAYANSVVITGTGNSSNVNSTFSFYRESSSSVDISANLFLNNRLLNGVHYAIGTNSTAAWTSSSSDFNLLYSSQGTEGLFGASSGDFSSWVTSSGGDGNSRNADVSLKFISIPNGDLRIPNDGSPEVSNFIIDKGSSGTVSDDVDEAHRSNLVDIGASEVLVNWKGLTSDWTDGNNWSTGVQPDCSISIKIGPNSGTVIAQPIIDNVTALFRELVILEGATLTLTATGDLEQCSNGVSPYSLVVNGTLASSGSPTITLYGDFYQNNSFSTASGAVVLIGTAAQSIDGDDNPVLLNNLTIDGGGPKNLNQPTRITGTLALSNGLINTSVSNSLTFSSTGTYSGGGSTSYINGPVAKETNSTTTFLFPIGKGGKFRVAGIEPSNTALSTFTAEYFNSSAITSFGVAKEASLLTISDVEYWIINRSGAANGKIHLTWDNVSGVSSDPTDRNQLRVVRWDGSKWTNRGNSFISGTATAGELVSNNITAFSPFTFGSQSANNPLPVELINFSARAVGTRVKISWETLSESNNDHFVIEISDNGEKFLPMTSVKGEGTSFDHQYYVSWDEHPLLGISYYRLVQVDVDGYETYSEVKKVNFVDFGETNLVASPNPVTNSTINFQINAFGENSIVALEIFDPTGRKVNQFEIQCDSRGFAEMDLTHSLANGFYIIKAMSTDHSVQTKLIVR